MTQYFSSQIPFCGRFYDKIGANSAFEAKTDAEGCAKHLFMSPLCFMEALAHCVIVKYRQNLFPYPFLIVLGVNFPPKGEKIPIFAQKYGPSTWKKVCLCPHLRESVHITSIRQERVSRTHLLLFLVLFLPILS